MDPFLLTLQSGKSRVFFTAPGANVGLAAFQRCFCSSPAIQLSGNILCCLSEERNASQGLDQPVQTAQLRWLLH